MKRWVFPVLLALGLSACASVPDAPETALAPAAPPALETQLAALKTHLFVLIQEERTRLGAGAKPLLLDSALSVAAQAHSDDMAKNRSFDAMDMSGSFAVNALLADPNFHGLVGENAASQYFRPQAGFDPETMARGFVEIWLNSPSHRSNLADPAFERTGIGVAANGDVLYAAEIFTAGEAP